MGDFGRACITSLVPARNTRSSPPPRTCSTRPRARAWGARTARERPNFPCKLILAHGACTSARAFASELDSHHSPVSSTPSERFSPLNFDKLCVAFDRPTRTASTTCPVAVRTPPSSSLVVRQVPQTEPQHRHCAWLIWTLGRSADMRWTWPVVRLIGFGRICMRCSTWEAGPGC